MGRKPNPLILEFFIRGPKLEDSSNRYQHTCKACNTVFPKGRIDSLTAHLVKKCPAISLRDRQKALLQLNDLPDLPDARNHSNSQVELPVGNRNWTALETLAEVSRQIDLSEKHDDRGASNNSAGSQHRADEQGRLDRFELQEQWTPDNPPLSYEARVQRDKKLLVQKINQPRDNETNSQQIYTGRTLSPSETIAMAAAAQAKFNVPILDPALIGEGLPQPPRSEVHSEPQSDIKDAEQALKQFLANCSDNTTRNESQNPTWPMLDGTAGTMYQNPDEFLTQSRVNTFPAISMNQGMTTEFSAEFGNGQKGTKPKVRGKFTANRRKEVQEVRKRGACIRCRMLKKPCSGDTPCNTCKNVESARLWKQPCVRTRIADELDMYTAGLHAVLAYHEVLALKSRIELEPSTHQIEATHYAQTNIFASFKALIGNEPAPEQNIDPALGEEQVFARSPNMVVHRALDNEHDDQQMKMESYIKRMSLTFYEKEPSKFMHITLVTALDLANRNQDQLLLRVLELWSTVHILVDHEVSWTLTEKSDTSADDSKPIDLLASYQLISMQLNAATEKIAAYTSKLVLNDLERRLLLRSSNQAFETFLVAIILLNCVEKSAWLFKSWEQDFLKARWPLDKTPLWYGSQGDRITDMLQMLLRMRGIPPKTYIHPETGLIATENEAARDWLEKLRLNYAEVLDKQDNPVFDPADSRCYELRFCSKLLLPVIN